MRRAHLIDLSLLLLLTGPLVAAEPSKFTLPVSAAADPLTVIGPASVCADQQIALWNGASNTSLQCSVLTVADTTGNITGPSGGFSIIGGTAATDDLILDGSAGTAGSVTITEAGVISASSGNLSMKGASTNTYVLIGAVPNLRVADSDPISGATTYDKVGVTASGLYIGEGGAPGEYGIHFEGLTANNFETGFDVIDPTADRQINLPDASGTVGTFVAAPSATGDACVTGQYAVDSGFIYFCVATNTWQRAIIAAW